MSICKKCGTTIEDGAEYCPKCGNAVTDAPAADRITMKCRQCGGVMMMDNEGDILSCPYCGSKELIRSSDTVSVEKIKQQTEFKKWEREDLKEAQKKKEQQERSYKFGAFGVISIICAVLFGICAATQFTNVNNFWNVLAGIVSLIGLCAFVASILFRRGIIKSDKKYLATLLMVAGFVLFIPLIAFSANASRYVATSTSSSGSTEEQSTAKPTATTEKLINPPTTSEDAYFYYYEDVILQFETAGFTNISTRTEWDSIDYDDEIGKTKYVTINGSRDYTTNDRFPADAKVVITYYSKDKSEKETEKPTEKVTEKPTQKPTQKPTEKAESKPESKSGSNTVSSSFKETMDSYEKFFDDYIAFMKKYKENPNDMELLTDYLDWMQKYSDYMEKLDSIDQDSLSDADLAYYIEVNTRISKKLLEANI